MSFFWPKIFCRYLATDGTLKFFNRQYSHDFSLREDAPNRFYSLDNRWLRVLKKFSTTLAVSMFFSSTLVDLSFSFIIYGYRLETN